METNQNGDRERSHNPDQDAAMHPKHETGKPVSDKSRQGTEEAPDGKGRDTAGYVNDETAGKESGDKWEVEGEGSDRNK